MKKMTKLLGILLALALLCTSLASCNLPAGNGEGEEGALSYVTLKINPEIELVVEDEVVVAVSAVNEDGELVIAETELVDMTVEEAAEAFTEAATELGYVDPESEEVTVEVEVTGEDEAAEEEIVEKISEKVHKFFDDHGIFGHIQKRSHEANEELKALAEEWAISLKEASLVARILFLYPEMEAEEVLALTTQEKLELLKDECKKEKKMTVAMREEYKEAVEALKEEYADMHTLREAIEALEESLADVELTEEEKAALEAELEAKKAELKTLLDAYKAEAEEKKDAFHDKMDEEWQKIKDKAEEHREQFKDAWDAHMNEFQEKKDEFQDLIHSWREDMKNKGHH
ncbi:MAG: hypothetical protein IJY71_01005 [Clostridia bacterium]|nr:hypothetical protein [Clostridia bacterium]